MIPSLPTLSISQLRNGTRSFVNRHEHHSLSHHVPRKVTLEMLGKIATVVDYYKCHSAEAFEEQLSEEAALSEADHSLWRRKGPVGKQWSTSEDRTS